MPDKKHFACPPPKITAPTPAAAASLRLPTHNKRLKAERHQPIGQRPGELHDEADADGDGPRRKVEEELREGVCDA